MPDLTIEPWIEAAKEIDSRNDWTCIGIAKIIAKHHAYAAREQGGELRRAAEEALRMLKGALSADLQRTLPKDKADDVVEMYATVKRLKSALAGESR